MLSRTEFTQALRSTLEEETTLDHPVFGELIAGTQPIQLLRDMALQGYQLTKHFLQHIETLYFYCPLPSHKALLLHNLYEEETGRISKTKNHVRLMQDFLRELGISDDEREAAVPLPSTQQLIDYRMVRVLDLNRYHEGAASVMIASEGQNLERRAGEARHEVLGKLYGLSAEATLFFSVHQKEDVGHVREGISLVADLCSNERMQREALEAVRTTCQLFRGMYDGIYLHWQTRSEAA